MKTTIKTIGADLIITNYSVKQKGYGRQGLYVEFLEVDGKHYIEDVFPNVTEHFDILLIHNAFFNEETGLYSDCDGNGEHEKVYYSIEEALNEILSGEEIEIEEEEEEEEEF